jgi:hypothetical protein
MLSCEDCGGTTDENTQGWVVVILESDEELVLLTYCPDCAAQFDPDDVWPIA